ncbi:hypothetical protein [Halorubrum vacuolatum]|uniref:Uncharacterized protein n=1 Tax=Halorubrum vacuolatum TaxID=63740 RepID=A0A238WNU5_HALVU|nr:hypothetical protein [Halorubrum vacuolatum]SNR47359.1 hypothetical protein SAMN06264855_108125 [Halorubrum vacuolatum]
MSAFPTEQLLWGLWYGFIGVAVWSVPFLVAYYLYRRWGGHKGPKSRRESS